MKRYRRIPVTTLIGVIGLSTLILFGCDVAPVPGRFTYIVKYEVTSEYTITPPANVDIQYVDDTGTQSPAPFTPPQSFEFTMGYDYGAPFDPELTFNSATFTTVGDKVIVKIIWKDYRVDFQEQVLNSEEVEYTGVLPPGITIFGPQLPK
jgi:hypothetical protein